MEHLEILRFFIVGCVHAKVQASTKLTPVLVHIYDCNALNIVPPNRNNTCTYVISKSCIVILNTVISRFVNIEEHYNTSIKFFNTT